MELKGMQKVRWIISFPIWAITAIIQTISYYCDILLRYIANWIESGHFKD